MPKPTEVPRQLPSSRSAIIRRPASQQLSLYRPSWLHDIHEMVSCRDGELSLYCPSWLHDIHEMDYSKPWNVPQWSREPRSSSDVSDVIVVNENEHRQSTRSENPELGRHKGPLVRTASLPVKLLQSADDPSTILRGGVLTKVRPGSRRLYRRRFCVDTDSLTLQYTDSRKNFLQKWRKSVDSSSVHIREIVNIIDGPPDSVQSHILSLEDKRHIFTLVIGEQEQRILSLIAPDHVQKAIWVNELRKLKEEYNTVNPAIREKHWLCEQFNKADVNKNGDLDANEIFKLLKSLNFSSLTRDEVQQKMMKPAVSRGEFVELYRELSRRDEIEELFNKYVVDDRNFLGPRELCNFFESEQSEKIDIADAESIIERSEPSPEFRDKRQMTMTGFNSMMASKQLNVMRPQCRDVYQDMTRPMSDYFINSSHNTYLEGNQLTSNSSVAQYERVLARGCRCVELDLWDGDDGEPIIYHGYTLTSKIKCRDALKGIAKYAFVKSSYPVILSLENHLSQEQQKRLARDLHEIFGASLFFEPLDDSCTTLPSPEQLKNKIVIKGKKLQSVQVDDVSDEDEAAGVDDEEVKNKIKKKSHKKQLAVELSNCVIICQSASFKGFEESAQKLTFAHMSSFEEEKAMKLAKEQTVDFVRHNAWQLSRTYPAGLRTNSSNYDPVPLWNVGCQVVALNFQTTDEPMLVNDGRFQDNGNCGYVLKPEFMRSRQSAFNCHETPQDRDKLIMAIRIISGFILPKKHGDGKSSILDPYILVEVFGAPADCHTCRTRVIQDNGFHPQWDELLTFTITCPDLALVMFRVMDEEKTHSDVMVAHYCLPFNCIQTGYRMVALRDIHGNSVGDTSLFVHIQIESALVTHF